NGKSRADVKANISTQSTCTTVLRICISPQDLESQLRAEQDGVFRMPRAGCAAIERGALVGGVELDVRIRIPVCRGRERPRLAAGGRRGEAGLERLLIYRQLRVARQQLQRAPVALRRV